MAVKPSFFGARSYAIVDRSEGDRPDGEDGICHMRPSERVVKGKQPHRQREQNVHTKEQRFKLSPRVHVRILSLPLSDIAILTVSLLDTRNTQFQRVRYHRTVSRMPVSKVCAGCQPSSWSIFAASIA